MRKIFAILALVGFSVLFVAPVVLAVTPPPAVTKCTMRQDLLTSTGWQTAGFYCPAAGAACVFDATALCGPVGNQKPCTCGSCCMLDTIYTITDWIFYILMAFGIIFIILGAFTILTAGGSPEKVNTGRSYIIYAVIGLLIGLAARGIPSLAKGIIGLG